MLIFNSFSVITLVRSHVRSVVSLLLLPVLFQSLLPLVAQASDVLPVVDTKGSSFGVQSVTTTGNTMTIQTNATRSLQDFSSFNVGVGNKVQINQPTASSAFLARVTGNQASTIAGNVSGNGQFWLANPNGVLVSPTGSITNFSGVVGTTSNMNNEKAKEFLTADAKTSLTLDNLGKNSITNQGTIKVANKGFVVLAGGNVSNEYAPQTTNAKGQLVNDTTKGLVEANEGYVGLAAADSVVLQSAGGSQLRLDTSGFVPSNSPFTHVINQQGMVRASSVSVSDAGEIVLASAGTVNIVVKQDAFGGSYVRPSISSTNDKGGKGGSVTLLGEHINQGGTVNVQGDTVAGTVTAKATHTYTQTGTVMANGDGGSVTVNKVKTTFGGNGGSISIEGGKTVRISASLQAKGSSNKTETGGVGGSITIKAGSDATDATSFGLVTASGFNADTTGTFKNGTTAFHADTLRVESSTNALSRNTLRALDMGQNVKGNVELHSGQDIVINADINQSAKMDSLTLKAERDVRFNANPNAKGTAFTFDWGGDMDVHAGEGIYVNQQVTSYGGTIDLTVENGTKENVKFGTGGGLKASNEVTYTPSETQVANEKAAAELAQKLADEKAAAELAETQRLRGLQLAAERASEQAKQNSQALSGQVNVAKANPSDGTNRGKQQAEPKIVVEK